MKRTVTKLLSVLLALSLLLPMASGFSGAAGAALPGDVNADGKVTAADARLALRKAVGLENYAEGSASFLACDVNIDGKVTAADARLILRAAVGLITIPGTDASKEEIVGVYKNAVNRIALNGAAGYTRKNFQTLDSINITGNSIADGMIKTILGHYFKDEASAETLRFEKGEEAKQHIPAWTLTDLSRVRSASTVNNGGNTKITIVMQEEDTPHQGSSFLSQVGSVLYWEDIEAELNAMPQLKELRDVHVIYRNYTITATLTPEGRLADLTHHADILIRIGHAKLVVTLENKSFTMEDTLRFTDFTY